MLGLRHLFGKLKQDHPHMAEEIAHVAFDLVPSAIDLAVAVKSGDVAARAKAIGDIMGVAKNEAVSWGADLTEAFLELSPARILLREHLAAMYVESLLVRTGADSIPAVHTVEDIVQTGYSHWKDSQTV